MILYFPINTILCYNRSIMDLGQSLVRKNNYYMQEMSQMHLPTIEKQKKKSYYYPSER